ncbi:YuzD family protein [Salicibibacter cibarius]
MSITITVYGAEKKCASCVNLPSALETKDWLEALLNRKYENQPLAFEYIDIENPEAGHEEFARYIIDDDRMYPLVTINGDIVAEGNPKLKDIYAKIDHLAS